MIQQQTAPPSSDAKRDPDKGGEREFEQRIVVTKPTPGQQNCEVPLVAQGPGDPGVTVTGARIETGLGAPLMPVAPAVFAPGVPWSYTFNGVPRGVWLTLYVMGTNSEGTVQTAIPFMCC